MPLDKRDFTPGDARTESKAEFQDRTWLREAIMGDQEIIDLLNAGISSTGHNHDNYYYTEAEADGRFVHLIGDESIAGIKTLTSIPILPGVDPTQDNEAVRKAYVDFQINANTIFGDEFAFVKSMGPSSTTNSAYTNKLTLSVTIPSGDYLLFWSCEIQTSNNLGEYGVWVYDGTEDYSEVEFVGLANKYQPVSGCNQFGDVAGGSHDIKIDFKSDDTYTAKIRRAYLMLWRYS